MRLSNVDYTFFLTLTMKHFSFHSRKSWQVLCHFPEKNLLLLSRICLGSIPRPVPWVCFWNHQIILPLWTSLFEDNFQLALSKAQDLDKASCGILFYHSLYCCWRPICPEGCSILEALIDTLYPSFVVGENWYCVEFFFDNPRRKALAQNTIKN